MAAGFLKTCSVKEFCVISVNKNFLLLTYRFVPAPTQVLLSEEITGSLRKLKVCILPLNSLPLTLPRQHYNYVCPNILKGCCTLTRDRFKSFEKRGLIVPTARSSRLVMSFVSFSIPMHWFECLRDPSI